MDNSYKIFEKDPRPINGNLQVIACAGSGKTDFVSKRIVTLLAKVLPNQNR